ncbi:MAG: hypothetical protein SGARI_005036 [Bacillariaceae sp.]
MMIDVGSVSDSNSDDTEDEAYATDVDQPSLGEETEVSLVENHRDANNRNSGWFSSFRALPTHIENDDDAKSSLKGDDGSISSKDINDDDGSEYSLPLRDHDNDDDDFSQQDPQEVGYDEFRQRMKKDKRKKLWRKLTLKNVVRGKRRESKNEESREEEPNEAEEEQAAWYDFGPADARETGSVEEVEENDGSADDGGKSCLKPTLGMKMFGAKLKNKFKKKKSNKIEKTRQQQQQDKNNENGSSFFGRQKQQEASDISDDDDYLSQYSSELASDNDSTKVNDDDDGEGWGTFLSFFANDQSNAERLMS